MRFPYVELPPVGDALVLGRLALVGRTEGVGAMELISPGNFLPVPVEYPVIEAVPVCQSDLHKVPQDVLIAEILQRAGPLMDETDALHVRLDVEVGVRVQVDLR